MTTWREAHRIAHIAAVHAQSDLGVSRDRYVDVFTAIRRAGIPMKFQQLRRLFGIYICPESEGPGILLNNGLSLTALRHTAAHELGHDRLRHGDTFDQQLDPWTGPASDIWSGPEMSAEAFAAWFLMPRPAVLRSLTTLGLRKPQTAVDAYRLATLLGASFRGLCRQIVNLRLATATAAQSWVKVGRSRLRQHLAGGYAEICTGEVHLLTPEMGNLTVHAGMDDLIVLRPGRPADVEISPDAGLTDVTAEEQTGQLELSSAVSSARYFRIAPNHTGAVTIRTSTSMNAAREWAISVRPVEVPNGIDLPWLDARSSGGQRGDPAW